MTTLSNLIERVRTYLRDADGAYVTDEDIQAWLNEAQTDIAARVELLQQEATGTTSGFLIAMPPGTTNPDMVEILSLRLGIDDVDFVSDSIFNSWKDTASVPINTLGRVFHNNIELYPTPATGTAYTLRYANLPAAMVVGSDIVSLPRQFERKLVEYAVASGYYKDGESQAGDRFLGRYETGLPPVNNGTRLNHPGPTGFTLAPSPFEADPGYWIT